jgi:predicted lipoprotein with Yx(FWY)xxD motif
MKLRAPLFVAFLLLVSACGTESGGSTTIDEDTTVTSSESTTSTVEAMEGVHVSDTDLGSILVDPEGFTLYVFMNDADGESTCNDACADLWPPVPADTPLGADLDPGIFGSTTRADGSEQLTVSGMPLYRYAPDTDPGDTTGQGFNGLWFVVDSGGTILEAAAGDRGLDDYGYGY